MGRIARTLNLNSRDLYLEDGAEAARHGGLEPDSALRAAEREHGFGSPFSTPPAHPAVRK